MNARRHRLLPDDDGPDWGLVNWGLSIAAAGLAGVRLEPTPLDDRLCFVSRDEHGEPQGILQIVLDHHHAPSELIVVVRPDRRRRGIATILYRVARDYGIDVESVSGWHGMTRAGAAFRDFRQGRLKRQ